MATNVSMLNRSILPRTRSLTLGWLTRNNCAACAWVRQRASISLLSRIIRSVRILRFSASSRENPRSRNTLPLERRILVVRARFLVLRDVEDAMFSPGVDTDLEHTRPDGGHGLPTTGHEALLHPAKLVAGGPAGVLRDRVLGLTL
jgi:hypothetical protein